MNAAVVRGLRLAGVDVETALEAGLSGRADEEQLRYAALAGRVLYTFDVGDFGRLHRDWLAEGRHHSGIVLVQGQATVGEQIRGSIRLVEAHESAELRDRIEFLSRWI